jgi:AraC family transcriptional regulator
VLSYERAFEDPLLAEIAHAIASELQAQISAGSLLVEALASGLAVRLVQKHFSASSDQSFPRLTREGLDQRRLFRVLDYVEANLEGDCHAAQSGGGDRLAEHVVGHVSGAKDAGHAGDACS